MRSTQSHLHTATIATPRMTCLTKTCGMQVTGLGNPHLLERVSNTLNQMRSLFKTFDEDSDGYITKEEFAKVNFSRDCRAATCHASPAMHHAPCKVGTQPSAPAPCCSLGCTSSRHLNCCVRWAGHAAYQLHAEVVHMGSPLNIIQHAPPRAKPANA